MTFGEFIFLFPSQELERVTGSISNTTKVNKVAATPASQLTSTLKCLLAFAYLYLPKDRPWTTDSQSLHTATDYDTFLTSCTNFLPQN